MSALVFFLLNRFLFVNGDNGADFASLITVVEQLEVGRTPMPLCVREMISGLQSGCCEGPKRGNFGKPPIVASKNILKS